ncbi:MAG: radical SAM protein [Candidatus Omnitrophica bacterium]|nr:radical SAM protein [Candidatus Omnitrophota bacterium]
MISCSKIFKGERTEHTQRKKGPLFVWNVTSRCNLQCGHCYRDASSGNGADDLTDQNCLNFIREIKELNPPIVLLTGGEPLLRGNIFDIIRVCRDEGLSVGLSTNGTLINPDMAKKIQDAGVSYVGISIDGNKEAHDRFRRADGSWEASWQGIESLNKHGVKTGVRFTLTAANRHDLNAVLAKTVISGTKRFCLYHLVYAGRAAAEQDMTVEEKRLCMEGFFKKIREILAVDPEFDVLTTDSPADGVFMLGMVNNKKDALACITSHKGCSAGDRVVYIDSNGDVFPCQFLREYPLGNILEEPLIEIWQNTRNDLLLQLRDKQSYVEGKCGICRHKHICGGCRARAQAYHGSLWAEDPGCYLTEGEVTPQFLRRPRKTEKQVVGV